MLVLLALLLIYGVLLCAKIVMVGRLIEEFGFVIVIVRCFPSGVMAVLGFESIVVLIRPCLRMFFDAGRRFLAVLRSI